jgi:drug/metabolite transporter (DMT)-like permease
MTVIIGFFALGEGLNKFEVFNMCFSFVGVVIIILSSTSQSKDGGEVSFLVFLLGLGACIISALVFAVVNVVIRSLKDLDACGV